MMRYISTARMAPGYRLHIAFTDGTSAVVELADLITKGGVYDAIAAAPEMVRVGPRGRSVQWPDSDGDVVDFCADALYLQMRSIQDTAAE